MCRLLFSGFHFSVFFVLLCCGFLGLACNSVLLSAGSDCVALYSPERVAALVQDSTINTRHLDLSASSFRQCRRSTNVSESTHPSMAQLSQVICGHSTREDGSPLTTQNPTKPTTLTMRLSEEALPTAGGDGLGE